MSKPLPLDRSYFKSFRIGRLYFRFILGTELEEQGWTAQKLALELEAAGYIQIIETQPQDKLGRWGKAERRYVELPGKQISKRDLVRMLLKENVS
jgi:hypothetical protein